MSTGGICLFCWVPIHAAELFVKGLPKTNLGCFAARHRDLVLSGNWMTTKSIDGLVPQASGLGMQSAEKFVFVGTCASHNSLAATALNYAESAGGF
jgi:hypothetical protein